MALDVVRDPSAPRMNDEPAVSYGTRPHTAIGSHVNWGAIISGSLVTLGFGAMFWLIGNALGLATVNLVSPTATSGLRAATWIYDFAMFTIAFLIGGYSTARCGELYPSNTSANHALVSWALAAVSSVILGIMVSMAFGSTIAGIGPNGANWLLCLLAISTCFASVFGALAGTRSFGLRTTVLRSEDSHLEQHRVA